MHPKKYEYIAFISYSRTDEKIVQRIHADLENYTIPKEFRTEEFKSGKLGKFFLDVYELGVSQQLNKDIEEKLDASKNLIIMCSPDSAKSDYVNAEIEYFKKNKPNNNIFIYLLKGEPNAKSRNEPEELELLPKALRNIKDTQSSLSIEDVGYAGADLRDLDKRTWEWKKKFNVVERTLYLTIEEIENIRMIAGLLSLSSVDLLINREERRKRVRLIQKVSIALLIVFLVIFGQYQYQKAKGLVLAESQATLQKARETYDRKDWKRAFLLFKKSFQQKQSLEAKIGLKLSSGRIVPEMAALDDFGKTTKLLFLDDNKTVALGGKNGTITLLDINSGKVVKKIDQKEAVEGTITDLKLTQNGKYILATSDMYHYPNSNSLKSNSGIVKICNIASSQCKIISKGDKASQVFSVDNANKIVFTQYTTDNKGFGTQGIFVWDAKLKKVSKKIFVGRGGYHKHLLVDKKTIITVFDNKLLFYDLITGKLKREIQLKNNIDDAVLLNSNKLLVYDTNKIGIYNIQEKHLQLFSQTNSYISTVDILKNKQLIIGGTESGKVYIWNYNGKLIASMRTNSTKINDIASTKDEKVIMIAGNDNRVSLYDVKKLRLKSYKPAIRLPKEKDFLVYAISPNNKYMAYGNYLIDLDSNKTIYKNIFSQQEFPLEVRFDPTSKKVVYEIIGEKKHKIIAIDIHDKMRWEDSFEDLVTVNDIAISPKDMQVAIATKKNIYITKKKGDIKKIPFETREEIKSLQFGYKGERVFILTKHFLYDYDLSLNSLRQQWYFGMDFMQNFFIHNLSNIEEQNLFFSLSLFLSNYNQIKNISKSVGKDLSFLEVVSLSLDSVFKHSKLYDTFFQNPPFEFKKVLAQSLDGKMLVALNKGYAVSIDPSNHSVPLFIDTQDKYNILSGTFGSKVFAVANFSKIYLYNKLNGSYIVSLADYYDHPVLSDNGDVISWIFANTFKSSIDLDTNNITDQAIFIPYILSKENRFLMKKSVLLAKERAKKKNRFQTLNKKLSISLQ